MARRQSKPTGFKVYAAENNLPEPSEKILVTPAGVDFRFRSWKFNALAGSVEYPVVVTDNGRASSERVHGTYFDVGLYKITDGSDEKAKRGKFYSDLLQINRRMNYFGLGVTDASGVATIEMHYNHPPSEMPAAYGGTLAQAGKIIEWLFEDQEVEGPAERHGYDLERLFKIHVNETDG